MARNRHRKGGALRRLLLVALVAVAAYYVAVHVRAYVDEQRYVQHYIDTHTTAPATPGH